MFLPAGERLDKLYWHAVELGDGAERQRFIEELRSRSPEAADKLEQLLTKQGAADAFFHDAELPQSTGEKRATPEVDNVDSSALTHWASARDVIDGYQICSVLGEGGMGIVFRAVRSGSDDQEVALKLIKPGMDSRQIVSRFEAELQTLGLMDHPNIARVLDAGTSHTGLPYFVMELVRGVSLTRYIKSHECSLENRLRLIQQACHAIQHAHSKGVIHRDIKPSNLLVSDETGQPNIKVIDFGIAKALESAYDPSSLHSVLFPVLGTPKYLSPEQADHRTSLVDTRSDVYSLGAVLYESLTGTTPLEVDGQTTLDAESIRRTIRDSPAVAPSQRVASLVSQHSKMPEGTVEQISPQQLCGELDWITLKSIEHDPALRYQSPKELSDDIDRYLSGSPVEAVPPSQIYRIKKWTSRHRMQVIVAGGLLAAILIGAGSATWAAISASSSRQIAQRSLAEKTETEKELRQLLYASNLNGAADAYTRNDAAATRDFLRPHIPRDASENDFRGFEWWYYWNQAQRESAMLQQGDEAIRCVTLDPETNLLVAGDASGKILLFDLRSREPCGEVDTGADEVWKIALGPEGRLLCGHGDGSISVYRLPSLKRVDRFQAFTRHRVAVDWTQSPPGVICGGFKGLLKWLPWTENQFDVDNVRTLSIPYAGSIVDLTASPPGPSDSTDWILAGGFRGGMSIVNLDDPPQVISDEQTSGMSQTHGISLARFSPLVARGQGSGLLSLYRLDQDTPSPIFRHLLPGGLHSVCFGPDDQFVYAGDASGYLHQIPVSANSGSMLTYLGDGLRHRIQSWKLHDRKIDGVVYDADRDSVITASRDGTLRVLGPDKDRSSRKLDVAPNDIAVDQDGTLYLCDGSFQRLEPPYRGSPVEVASQGTATRPIDGWYSVDVAVGASQVFASHAETRLFSWRAGATEDPWLVWQTAADETLFSWDVTDDGRRLVANLGRSDPRRHRVALIDLSSGAEVYSVESNSINAMAISPDGRWLAVSRDDNVAVVELMTGVRHLELSGHTTAISDIRFSRDGSHLASVSEDRTVRCWHFPEGKLSWSAVAHQTKATSLAFHPDGKTLATVGYDSLVRFWRYRTGQQVGRIPVSSGLKSKLAFDPSGEYLFVGNADGETIILNASGAAH
ncbi:MAG: serine/threonine-protein kinase [Planctomycetota bacterium]